MFTCLNSFTEKNFAAEAKETIFEKALHWLNRITSSIQMLEHWEQLQKAEVF